MLYEIEIYKNDGNKFKNIDRNIICSIDRIISWNLFKNEMQIKYWQKYGKHNFVFYFYFLSDFYMQYNYFYFN